MSGAYVRFWGVRGSYPAPFTTHMRAGGNTSCVEVRAGDYVLACDAGSGLIALGDELMRQDRIREITLLLTHYHWDHISGLPFFQPAFASDWTLRLFGPGKNESEIQEVVAQQMRAPYFPVETETWLADVRYLRTSNGCVEHGPIRAYPFNVHHPGSTFGYRIEVAGRSVVYISDNELNFLDQSIDERLGEHDLDAGEHELLLRMKEEERRSSLSAFTGADILIHDAQYTPEDYARKRGWGHSCFIDTVNCAVDAGVGDLYLYHLDPSYPDDRLDAIHREALRIVRERDAPLRCHVAREGLVIELER
jgi:phosphoribosyl 1,2-cyclic phosphodiesterase